MKIGVVTSLLLAVGVVAGDDVDDASTSSSSSSRRRILVYSPRMMQSHVNFMARLANLLAKVGHDVVGFFFNIPAFQTVLDSVLRYDVEHGVDTSIAEVITVPQAKEVEKLLKTGNVPKVLWDAKPRPEDQQKVMEILGHPHREQCLHLANQNLISDWRKRKFDLAIHEVFDTCGLGIIAALGIKKTIVVSSTVMMDSVATNIGMYGPWKQPGLLSDYGSDVNYTEIRRNLQFHSAWNHFFEMQAHDEQKTFLARWGVVESFEQLLRKTNLVFTNTDAVVDARRPWSRRVFDVGGIAIEQPKPLVDDYAELLGNWSSVVLVSFGTAAPSSRMPDAIKKSFLRTFQNLSDTLFIWKYEQVDAFSKSVPPNVVLRAFTPQNDLLHSGKVDLFVSHCGQNSMLEALQAGVKLLAVPMFGDQHRNAKAAEEAGLVDRFAKSDLTDSKKLVQAIRKQLSTNKHEKERRAAKASLDAGRTESAQIFIRQVAKLLDTEDPQDFANFPTFWRVSTLILVWDVVFYSLTLIAVVLIWKTIGRCVRR